jgi:hypothetical protein
MADGKSSESHLRGDIMSNDKSARLAPATPDLNTPYRPLGLKAVAAAALMLRKPKLTPAR